MGKSRKWTEDEKQFVINNYKTKTNPEIAIILNRKMYNFVWKLSFSRTL